MVYNLLNTVRLAKTPLKYSLTCSSGRDAHGDLCGDGGDLDPLRTFPGRPDGEEEETDSDDRKERAASHFNSQLSRRTSAS